jgi:hypothetical protein
MAGATLGVFPRLDPLCWIVDVKLARVGEIVKCAHANSYDLHYNILSISD